VIEPVEPSVGWGVLHLFFEAPARADREAIAAAVKSCQSDAHQVIPFAVLGHKADVGFMALGPDLARLQRLQADLVAAGLELTWSFVSLTELSEYAQGLPAEMAEARLHPQLPPDGKRAMCFYPMSKRRNVGQNWYVLPYGEREELMRGHGKSGRTFAGRILQLITASTGVDDHEWGVTLFGVHADDLKAVVYTMRYDQASAIYAEFGPFYTGMVTPVEELFTS